MIQKITLKKVACYWDIPAILETNKKVNLVYGLNWTWKTTISRYLQNKNNLAFSNCNIHGYNWEKILVYNQDFIKDTFYEKENFPWIFSLWKENKEAKMNIDNAEKEIKKLNLILNNDDTKKWLNIDLENKENEIIKLNDKYKNKFWKIIENYDKKSLSICLEWYKRSKDDLLSFISWKELVEENETIETLEKEATDIFDDNAEEINESIVKTIDFNFSEIESDKIFGISVVWNNDLQISELINNLKNSDWVKIWFQNYVKEPTWWNIEICPFCQQMTISENIYNEILNYFDETYDKQIKKIDKLYSDYEKAYNNLKILHDDLLKVKFIRDKEKEFNSLFFAFDAKLKNNLSEIKRKRDYPSNKDIKIELSNPEQNNLNSFLNDIIFEIKWFNEKLKNKKKTKQKIKEKFWNLMRKQYDDDIKEYHKSLKDLNKWKESIFNEIDKIKENIKFQSNIINDNQRKIITTKNAIDNINKQLLYFWLGWFSIIPSWTNWENEYKLARPWIDDAKFESLSEWEKTVISFLYFLELCKGKEKKDEITLKKIIVIDDPISSLSNMYVFNVAQLIWQNFFQDNDYEQVFILTHNLYFFHELITIGPRANDENWNRTQKTNCWLFRIYKNKNSMISTLKQDEIQNEYQSYWQILKENKSSDYKDNKTLVANAMRNILEYFFSFINRETLNNALQTLDKDKKYTFFTRYINRESHSDWTNIYDMKDFDLWIFYEAFEKIFNETNFEEHYKKMMNNQ